MMRSAVTVAVGACLLCAAASASAVPASSVSFVALSGWLSLMPSR